MDYAQQERLWRIRNAQRIAQQQALQAAQPRTRPAPTGIDPRAWISEIGGTIGGIGGGFLGGPVGAIAGATAGSAIGKSLEQAVKQEPINYRDVATEAALSGLFTAGPIKATKGLLGLAKSGVSSAARAAGGTALTKGGQVALKEGGEEAVRQAVRKAPKPGAFAQGYASALGVDDIVVPGKYTPKTILKSDEIAREAARAGIQGSPKTMQRQALAAYDEIGKQLSTKLKASTKTRSLAEVKKEFAKELKDILPVGSKYDVQVRNTLRQLDKYAKNGKITSESVYKFKNKLRVSRAFQKASGDIQSDFTPKELVDLEIWGLVDKQVGKLAGQKAKELSMRMSRYYGLSQALAKQARSGIPQSGTEAILTFAKPVATSITTRATRRAATKEVGEKVAQELTEQAATTTGRRLTAGQAAGIGLRQLMAAPLSRPTVEETAVETTEPTDTGIETMGMEETETFDPRLNTIALAIQQDISRTGGKNIKNIQMIAGLYGIDLSPIGLGTTTKSKIDATTKRNLAAISTAESVLNELESNFESAGGAKGPFRGLVDIATGKVGESPKVQAYRKLRSGYMSRISRSLGEVGVLTDADIKRSLDLVPDVTDTPEEAQIKLRSLRATLQDSYNQLIRASQL